jgi:hypothetical protein
MPETQALYTDNNWGLLDQIRTPLGRSCNFGCNRTVHRSVSSLFAIFIPVGQGSVHVLR